MEELLSKLAKATERYKTNYKGPSTPNTRKSWPMPPAVPTGFGDFGWRRGPVTVPKFRLRISETSMGKVELDGVDISNGLLAVSYSAAGGKLAEIELKYMGELDADVAAHLEKITLEKVKLSKQAAPLTGRVRHFKV